MMSTQYLFVAAIKAALKELFKKLQSTNSIMDQSIAKMLRQLCYAKISFIVCVTDIFYIFVVQYIK